MKKHLSNKEIIKYFVEQQGGKDYIKVRKHLDECKKCSLKYEKLQKITTPYYNAISLNTKLRERILRSYQEIKIKQPDKKIRAKSFQYPSFKYKVSFALVLILFLTVAGFYFFNKDHKEQIFFSIQEKQGNVLLNNRNLTKGSKLSNASRLLLTKDTRVKLAFYNKMKIILAGESNFYIKEAYFDKYEKKYNFLFKIRKGQVFSDVNNLSGSIIYSYETPQVIISPCGTKFLLKCNQEKTELYLKEGEVNLTLNTTGEKLLVGAVSKYIITKHNVSKSRISAEDENYVKYLITGDTGRKAVSSGKIRKTDKSFHEEKLPDQSSNDNDLKKELQKEKKNIKKELHRIHSRNRKNIR